MVIVITSGYFDPLHVGHLDYLKKAKGVGDMLVCIVNNDEQAKLKKKKPFMSEWDRVEIISSLACVDRVVLSEDVDESVCRTLKMLKENHRFDTVIFAKGGDRHSGNIPEAETCRDLGIFILEGLGEKIRASSELIKQAQEETK